MSTTRVASARLQPRVYSIRSASYSSHHVSKNNPLHIRRCTTAHNDGEQVKMKQTKNGIYKEKHITPPPKPLTKGEYEYFQQHARDVSKEEREAALDAAEKKKERLVKESMARKEMFRRIDMQKKRENAPRFNEIEAEARKRTMALLERAYDLKLEEEEEIQKCNRLILENKCRAIRDAQIAEKKLIEQQLAQEEERLNALMENQRRESLLQEERKEREEAAKRQKFANILKNQIVENEENRIIEFEHKQEESRLINRNNIARQQEEIAKLKDKQIINEKIRKDLAEGNEQLRHFKEMEREESRIIDERIREYQKAKREKEEKLIEEQKRANLRKEREKQRVAAQARQAQDVQAQIDELNAARIQEEVEREWRRREKEEALKKSETQKLLKMAREEQVNDRRMLQAMEIERDKREFEKIVEVQKQAIARDLQEREKRRQKALSHRNEILRQMNEKERERILAKQKIFEEGLAIRTEAEMRKMKLRKTMERKCQEMRDNKVPEIYINEVRRMIENI